MTILSKLLVFLSLLATVSCGPTYYKATMMNVPNFKEKGEAHFATNLGTSNVFYSFHGDVQGAYAVTNHLAIQGNYMIGSDVVRYRTFGFNDVETQRFFSLGEAAIGYFEPLDKSGTFSVFGGYGAGKVSNDVQLAGASSADLSKLFVQSSVGIRDENIEFIGSAKLSALNYTNRKQTLKDQFDIDRFNALSSTIAMLETGLVIRFGGEKVKFQMQGTTALQLVQKPLFMYSPLTLSAGVCFQLNTKTKKEAKKKSK